MQRTKIAKQGVMLQTENRTISLVRFEHNGKDAHGLVIKNKLTPEELESLQKHPLGETRGHVNVEDNTIEFTIVMRDEALIDLYEVIDDYIFTQNLR